MAENEIFSPHIAARPGQIAKALLFPGDPLRAKALAERYFEDAECFNTIRGMYGYTGFYRGRRLSVMGSGMGIPSAMIYAHEMYHVFGVESILRIGTAGGISDRVKVRDVMLAVSASTDSNFSAQYGFPGVFAPAADFRLLRTAAERAEARGLPYAAGGVYTTDVYYNHNPAVNEKACDLGLLCVDMETAGLYWEAAVAGRRALSIMTVSNNIFTGEELPAGEREQSLTDMMELALDTAWEFAE